MRRIYLAGVVILSLLVLVPSAGAKTHRANVGPPLGYYYTVVKTCQHNPNKYYHNKPFYKACQQAKVIITNSGKNDVCKEVYIFGISANIIAKATGVFDGWAAIAFVGGLGFACFLH